MLAYFIVPGLRKHLFNSPAKFWGWVARSAKEAGGISVSALLSAVVTILLSRISESQFLIQVTVTDFWGAIAIGFVANYLGWNVLNKIVPRIGAAEDHGAQDHGKKAISAGSDPSKETTPKK